MYSSTREHQSKLVYVKTLFVSLSQFFNEYVSVFGWLSIPIQNTQLNFCLCQSPAALAATTTTDWLYLAIC